MLFEAFQTLSGRCKSIPCNQWNCTEEKEDNFNEDHYDLEDRNGIKLREADNNLFQIPARFVVKDINDSKLMYTEGKTFSLRKEFSLYDNADKFLGTMKNKLPKLKGHKYWIERNGVDFMWIFGNFTGLDYQMEVNGVQVASVHKNWFSMRDQIGLSKQEKQ